MTKPGQLQAAVEMAREDDAPLLDRLMADGTVQGDDLICGGGGDDNINGQWGDDVIIGGEGDDNVIGHQGNDFLVGGEGHDHLNGGQGLDTCVDGEIINNCGENGGEPASLVG